METQHKSLQGNKFHTIPIVVWRRSSTTRRDQAKAEDKDLLESGMLKAVVNLQKYQEEIRAWRDLNVKLRELNIGDLVLLWSPRIESSSKMESKWAEPYMVMEKSRMRVYRLSDSQGKMMEHS
jgi:hypothetical protein